MKFLEKHPLIMIVIGIAGISLSAIFVKYSQAPAVVAALYRIMWTVALMTPVVLGRKDCRRELMDMDRKTVLLCGASGVFLAVGLATAFSGLVFTGYGARSWLWASFSVCAPSFWDTVFSAGA